MLCFFWSREDIIYTVPQLSQPDAREDIGVTMVPSRTAPSGLLRGAGQATSTTQPPAQPTAEELAARERAQREAARLAALRDERDTHLINGMSLLAGVVLGFLADRRA